MHFLFLWRPVVSGHSQRIVPPHMVIEARFEEMQKTFKGH